MLKHKFTETEDLYIINNYYQKTIKQIANDLNLTYKQVEHRIYRHLNVLSNKKKKHILNEKFFKKNSHNKFYIIGLIAADGNLFNDYHKNKFKVSISQNSKDIKLLNDVNDLICETNLVHTRKNVNLSELSFYNETIYNEIKKYKITENKSLTLKFPDNIPSKYIHDFIRGYFDGDGSLSIGKYNKLTIQFLGTRDFLDGIVKIINNKFGFSYKNINDTKTNIKCLRYFTKEARTIMRWLYKDKNCLKLKRKYNKFKNYSVIFND